MKKIGFFYVYRFCEQNLEDKYKPFAPAICFEMTRDIWREYSRFAHLASAQEAIKRYLDWLYVGKGAFAQLEINAYNKITERIGYKAWLDSHTQKSNP